MPKYTIVSRSSTSFSAGDCVCPSCTDDDWSMELVAKGNLCWADESTAWYCHAVTDQSPILHAIEPEVFADLQEQAFDLLIRAVAQAGSISICRPCSFYMPSDYWTPVNRTFALRLSQSSLLQIHIHHIRCLCRSTIFVTLLSPILLLLLHSLS